MSRRMSFPVTLGVAALLLALSLPALAQAKVEASEPARPSSGKATRQPSLRGITPIETELLDRESAAFKSTRSIFEFVAPPAPPPPPPPPPPPDTDKDGIPDFRDNCPATKNPDQSDIDRDGVGTACETELPEKVPPPPPPPKPRPPAFNYSVLGTFGPARRPLAVFSRDGEILNVAVGDSFGPGKVFILQRIGIESVEIGFKDFPASQNTRVRIGK